MVAVPIILLIILIPFIYIFQNNRHTNLINEQVASMGGSVISIERRNFFTGLGPFMVVGKGRTIYRFEYTIGSIKHEGWVRFGGLFGADWRL